MAENTDLDEIRTNVELEHYHMSKREKILVGLMLLAVVYGIYVWFLSAPQQAASVKGHNEQNLLNAFIIKVAEKTTTGLSKSQAYTLQKAETKWKRDPFMHIEPKTSEEEEDSLLPVLKSKILYTGFLRMGDKRLAIINGMEYETGDILEPGGFVIRSISPSRVAIVAPGKKKKTIILPMEETE
jgi:hypothetical protein